jgi:hypothetical protein
MCKFHSGVHVYFSLGFSHRSSVSADRNALTLFDKKYYRLFAFWDKTNDEDTFVLATHGIIKKTKKTPKNEIKKAEGIRKIYFEQKHRKQ